MDISFIAPINKLNCLNDFLIAAWMFNDINLSKGDEMDRCNMGSTVILLMPAKTLQCLFSANRRASYVSVCETNSVTSPC